MLQSTVIQLLTVLRIQNKDKAFENLFQHAFLPHENSKRGCYFLPLPF